MKTILKFSCALTIACLSACSSVGPVEENVSADFSVKQFRESTSLQDLAVYQTGSGGETVVFMHGIPTHSYLWRNVMPIVGEQNTALAFDLPGYGYSDVPTNAQYDYINLYEPSAEWLSKQSSEQIILVVNDLGSLIGIDWAIQNPSRIKGLVLVEAAFLPSEQFYEQITSMQKMMFRMMRINWFADYMVVKKPRMQSMALDMFSARKLEQEVKDKYLQPYGDHEKRKVVRYGPGPSTMPAKGISKAKNDVADVMNRNAAGLLEADFPILLLTAKPGLLVQEDAIEFAKANFKQLNIQEIGAGKHFVTEDQPTAIGEAINKWIESEFAANISAQE
jgi:haloalkane dehalogenase